MTEIELMKLLEDFETDERLRGLTQETILRYRTPIRHLISLLAEKELGFEALDKDILKEFLSRERTRNISDKTLMNYFSAISSFYEYLLFEGVVTNNPVPSFRRRYLHNYKSDTRPKERRLLSVEEMSRLVNYIIEPRAKAIAVLFAKTGIRKGELIAIDLDDIDWENYSITLKRKAKRSNRVVFFDEECAVVLKRWIRMRDRLGVPDDCRALFVNYNSRNRIDKNRVYEDIVKPATALGFHNPNSEKLIDHFSPHAFRHWFTTWLLRNGMPREYVKELRGDSRHEAIDIYNHLDMEDVRREYLTCIPKLGV
ncbi:tyrosine-type recombinase/integrase [candidate division WOR-3 bacterium]|nr:tyrosine-type recombinase/integrase [candidate division WOR-3 bacterium]